MSRRKDPEDDYKSCPVCGALYLNFCVHCDKRGTEERVWELLKRHGLDENFLIQKLAEQVKEGKFPALNLAISLREMKPADKHEVDLSEGTKINDARDRLSAVLSKLAGRRSKD